MVLADNRAYDYNARRYLEQEQQPSRQPQRRPKKKPRLHFSTIVTIALAFTAAIFVISRYAYIAEINFNIHKLQNAYLTEQKNNTELNAKLAGAVNLEKLEDIATNELHMQYPDVQTQVIYVKVPTNAAASSAGIYSEYSRASDVQENRYVALAKNLFGSVMKIID